MMRGKTLEIVLWLAFAVLGEGIGVDPLALIASAVLS
jgi:hypothetical protein